ncbi:MAG TPA: hypothetical protein VKF82_05315 [Candidatus Eremiobacteraceae bacterium]|nr:hypothetical protein [Candidatus Eremiobacteraceae bacterium]
MLAGPKIGFHRVAAAAAALSLCTALIAPMTAAASPTPARMVADGGGVCGSLEIGNSNSAAVLAAENCFSKAFTNCDAAVISVAYHGGDAGVARTFQTMRTNTDSCEVAEVVDHYKGSNVASSDTYLCNDVKQGGDGLTFTNCGADGTVFVPANLTASNSQKLLTISFKYRQTA